VGGRGIGENSGAGVHYFVHPETSTRAVPAKRSGSGGLIMGILNILHNDRGGKIMLAVLALVTVLVPVLNLLVPEGSFLHIPTYLVTLLGKYLTYALLAVAVDLVWGYLGILSLGHGAFFALGGYAMGMYLMRQIGDRGVYGNASLPDFMVFLNWKELPWFWQGFDMFWFAMLMVVLVPAVLAFVFGWLAFRSRVTGVYLSIITQALTYALLLAFFRNEMGFGGNNGLTDFKDILGFSLQSDNTRVTLFVLSGLALAGGYLLCRYIINSKLGRVIVAIRDAESRTRFVGYRVEHYKVWVFTVSAMLAGVAGALYVPQVGIINPGEFSPLNSIEVVIWVAIGGRATLYGAVIGAILVNYAKTVFTGLMPDSWLFLLGALFVLVTLYLPQGLAGLVQQIKDNGWLANLLKKRGATA
jgi:urea transport system permease protein